MEKDKNLEELFRNFHPDLGNKDLFMASLIQKMEAVEYVKRVQDAQIRQYKMAVLAAFVVGAIVSMALIAIIIFMPTTTPIFHFNNPGALLLFIEKYSYVIAVTILSLIVGINIIGFCKGITYYQPNIKKLVITA